jgi:hypothetical protein
MSKGDPTPRKAHRRQPRLKLAVWGNPLARNIDRTEATLFVCALWIWFLALPVLATIGSSWHSDLSQASADQERDRTKTTALLLEDAPPYLSGELGAAVVELPRAKAQWVGPDRSEHTGTVPSAGRGRSGDRVPIWVDQVGNITDPPLDGTTATAIVVLATAGAWISFGALLGSVVMALGHRFNRQRLANWDRDWQRIEPLWSGRSR